MSGSTSARTQVFWLQVLCSLVSVTNLLSLSSKPTLLNLRPELSKSLFSYSLVLLGSASRAHLGEIGRWEEGERGFLPGFHSDQHCSGSSREKAAVSIHYCCQHQPCCACSEVPAAARLAAGLSLSHPEPGPPEHFSICREYLSNYWVVPPPRDSSHGQASF